jgi:site-specific recombinase XerC
VEAQVTFSGGVEAFLAYGDACGHTVATRKTYASAMARFRTATGLRDLTDLTPEVIEHYLAELRGRVRPVSAHQAYRTLRTFTRWCTRTGRLATDPMAGLVVRAPKTLPRVPNDDAVSQLLAVCPPTWEGRRNRAMIALLADSGLRKEELRRLRCADVDLGARLVHVRAGKGQKDGTTFFGDTTASLLRTWLAAHPDPQPAAPIYCTREGTMLGPSTVGLILGRLSRRAGLSVRIGPHALRHYAATSLLRRTGDLELVRRVLRHESLAMTLRYAILTQTEVAAKFLRSSPLDHLWAGAARGRAPGAKGNVSVSVAAFYRSTR